VPEISRFFGIVIAMYHREHNPPHFHVKYGQHRAAIAVRTLEILEGRLPPRVYGLVAEWTVQHRQALLANWDRGRKLIPLERVPPLD
jgi:hypothetical protein